MRGRRRKSCVDDRALCVLCRQYGYTNPLDTATRHGVDPLKYQVMISSPFGVGVYAPPATSVPAGRASVKDPVFTIRIWQCFAVAGAVMVSVQLAFRVSSWSGPLAEKSIVIDEPLFPALNSLRVGAAPVAP